MKSSRGMKSEETANYLANRTGQRHSNEKIRLRLRKSIERKERVKWLKEQWVAMTLDELSDKQLQAVNESSNVKKQFQIWCSEFEDKYDNLEQIKREIRNMNDESMKDLIDNVLTVTVF